MLISVEHKTAYSYSEPLLAGIQYVRMSPLSGRTQGVESWKLSAPGALAHPWVDQYGNLCHTLTVADPVLELTIRVSGLVRTRETNGVVGVASSELPSGLYLRETPYTVCAAPVREFAAPFRGKVEKDQIEGLHAIMLAIADAVEYRPGETHVHTTGAEALTQGSGESQEHADIFCAMARFLGVPARYVSGYLAQGAGHAAHAASHAWAEAFVEHLGWVGFDPTNRACPDESYIRTAVGLDYAEAGPVRGLRSGGGLETMRVSVVFPEQQQQVQ
jgi:transglutaminase-like putative cysteine protease